MTQPDADELRARASLQALGVSYAPAPPVTAPAREPQTPGEEAARTVPTPRQGGRLPDWRLARKPELSAHGLVEPEDQELDAAPEETSPGLLSLRDRVRTWVESVEERTGYSPAPADPPQDTGDGPVSTRKDSPDATGDSPENTGDTGEESGPGEVRPPRRPRFDAPGLRAPAEHRSLLEVIRSTPDYVVWLLYSGSALAAGFWLGWPQWFRDAVDYLVTEHPTLTDPYAFQCYAVAAAVLVVDWRTRSWVLPLAWMARIPSASLVIGAAMNGDPTPISDAL